MDNSFIVIAFVWLKEKNIFNIMRRTLFAVVQDINGQFYWQTVILETNKINSASVQPNK